MGRQQGLRCLVKVNLLEAGRANLQHLVITKHSPFCYFKTSPEIIYLALMLLVRLGRPVPLAAQQVDKLTGNEVNTVSIALNVYLFFTDDVIAAVRGPI